MITQISTLFLDESKWFTTALGVACIAVVVWASRLRRSEVPRQLKVLAAMNLAYACVIGTMAFGHILAVTIKLAQGTLGGSPLLLYPLGLALGVPAWWLAVSARKLLRNDVATRRTLLFLNAWLAVCLIALGLTNLVLAIPAALNIAYQRHSKRALGLSIVIVTIAVYLFLFVGSLIFLASGGSFEEFRGID